MDDRAFGVAFHEGQAATFDELEAIAGPEIPPPA
jgi:hypothetical protein